MKLIMEASQSGRVKHTCLKNAEDQHRDLIDLTTEYAMNQYALTNVLVSQQSCLLTTGTDPYTGIFPMYSQPDTDYIRRLQQKDNTSALKLWLLQHKKNPYPSKPEKIMLAVLAKMTLTQVSTWFANARRRLKKDYPDVAYYSTDTGSHVIYYHKE